ncbi:MAG: DUF2059 domain-containing protein [Gemmatimonadales bacterium]
MRRLHWGLVLVCGLVSLTAAPAQAQTTGAVSAATELLQVMRVDRTIRLAVATTFDAEIAKDPSLAVYREVMLEFTGRYLSWDALGSNLVSLYAETFTEDELRALTAFYRTPVGQKLIEVQPELMRKGSEMGQNAVMSHMGELQEMLKHKD